MLTPRTHALPILAVLAGLTLLAGCGIPSFQASVDHYTGRSQKHAGPPLTRTAAIEKYLSDRKLSAIEGVWAASDNSYEFVIARNTSGSWPEYEFMAVLTESHSHDWTSGDIKMVLKAAATERVLPAFYFTRGETGFGTTVLLTNPNVLEFSLPTGYYGSSERYIYIRVFPKDAAPPTNRAAGVGTGFFVAPDLVVTNAHVVGAGRAATVRFGGASAGATVLLKDQTNDLALVRVDGGQTAASPTPATSCLQLGDADLVKGGDRVFVIGYPLSDLLGTASSITEGLVTRVAGAQDDPRVLQISAPVQPGSSGSPVFDAQGRVIGVVTSILVSSGSRALPQNVNFAVKVSYLKPLMALVPESTCTSLVTGTTAPLSARDVQERFGTAVVQIEATP